MLCNLGPGFDVGVSMVLCLCPLPLPSEPAAADASSERRDFLLRFSLLSLLFDFEKKFCSRNISRMAFVVVPVFEEDDGDLCCCCDDRCDLGVASALAASSRLMLELQLPKSRVKEDDTEEDLEERRSPQSEKERVMFGGWRGIPRDLASSRTSLQFMCVSSFSQLSLIKASVAVNLQLWQMADRLPPVTSLLDDNRGRK